MTLRSLPAAWYLRFPTVSWVRVQSSMTRTYIELALQTQSQHTKICLELKHIEYKSPGQLSLFIAHNRRNNKLVNLIVLTEHPPAEGKPGPMLLRHWIRQLWARSSVGIGGHSHQEGQVLSLYQHAPQKHCVCHKQFQEVQYPGFTYTVWFTTIHKADLHLTKWQYYRQS